MGFDRIYRQLKKNPKQSIGYKWWKRSSNLNFKNSFSENSQQKTEERDDDNNTRSNPIAIAVLLNHL